MLKNEKTLSIFKSRIKTLSIPQLNSSKYYEGNLFDKDLPVENLKEAIQTIDDLISLLEMGNMKHRHTLFNYLISTFPLPKKNRNLTAHLCDNQFLQKIIHNKTHLNTVLDIIGSTSSLDCRKICLNRLYKTSTYIANLEKNDLFNNTENNSAAKFPEIFPGNSTDNPFKDALLNSYNHGYLIKASPSQHLYSLSEVRNNDIQGLKPEMSLRKPPRTNITYPLYFW